MNYIGEVLYFCNFDWPLTTVTFLKISGKKKLKYVIEKEMVDVHAKEIGFLVNIKLPVARVINVEPHAPRILINAVTSLKYLRQNVQQM